MHRSDRRNGPVPAARPENHARADGAPCATRSIASWAGANAPGSDERRPGGALVPLASTDGSEKLSTVPADGGRTW